MFIAALCIIAKCSKQPKCPLLDEQIKKLWYIFLTYGQDGGIGRHTLPPCTTKRRTTTHLKNKKQPEWTENQAVWKSNNQGVKEETFIQASRRGGEGLLGQTGLMARQ